MTESAESADTTISSIESKSAEVSLPWILAVILRDRRLIGWFVGIAFVIAVGVGLLKRATYSSTFSFLSRPADDQDRSGLANLAGQFGISLGALRGSAPPPQLYADLVLTRSMLLPIVSETLSLGDGRRIAVPEFFGVKESNRAIAIENAMGHMRRRVVIPSVATFTTGVVTVTVRTESPEVSLQIARQLLDNVNRFPTTVRRSQAAEERRFTEGRLSDAKAALRSAEDALQRFLQSNRQYAGSPELTFQKERLDRDVALHQQVVSGLAQQYEDARIREVRDTPVLTVIDQPALAVLPDPRGRVLLVLVLTTVGFFAGTTFAIAREGWRRQRRNHPDDESEAALAAEWQRARGGLTPS
jgi:uncharacterized protein involved in exopolysaccharide biosynthesis